MIQSRGKYFIEIALFVSGAVGMIIEIVGSRLMAPYFGNSLFVWTALIGVVLGALSFGYFIGGKLADKELSLKIFSSLLLFASILIMGLYIADFALMPDFLMFSRYKLLSIVAAIMLFGPPSIALGMISPYGIRLKIENLKHSGSTIGNLYAISTLGSITGTFMA
ncbi:MAG: fused MFS/spermidine synthase, partial [Candidatus Berkelbacteria bacterium]|nr:fused MFS/spermidine synthase [Candidatus Berkelbacteria bacterium]